jgi:hypothetical protein
MNAHYQIMGHSVKIAANIVNVSKLTLFLGVLLCHLPTRAQWRAGRVGLKNSGGLV